MSERKVLCVCSDHPGWLAVSRVLDDLPGVRRLREVQRAAEAIATARREQPNVILVADEVGNLPFYALLKGLREVAPESRLIVLTADLLAVETREALRDMGVATYLAWGNLRSCDLLRKALELVILHGFIVSTPGLNRPGEMARPSP